MAMDETIGKRDGKVTESMDCFSAGCVIAELFLEGAPLFTLSQLFKYREGELNVDAQLSAIEDGAIRVSKNLFPVTPCLSSLAVEPHQADDSTWPLRAAYLQLPPPYLTRDGVP